MSANLHASDDWLAASRRVALIDDAETLVSDDGFRTPLHRSMAKLVATNAGLLK